MNWTKIRSLEKGKLWFCSRRWYSICGKLSYYIKGYYCWAIDHMPSSKFKKALFEFVAKKRPKACDTAMKLERKQAFERAKSNDRICSLMVRFFWTWIFSLPSYRNQVFPSTEKIGLETFKLMEDLIKFYGNQKKLHGSFAYEVCVFCFGTFVAQTDYFHKMITFTFSSLSMVFDIILF